MEPVVMKIPMTCILVVVLSGLIGAQAVPAGRTFHLDLTQPGVVQTFSVPIMSEGGLSSVMRNLPLTVRLLSLDRQEYEQRQAIVFDVELTHVGDQPFDLPWSADLTAFEGDSSFDLMTVLLQANRPNKVRDSFASLTLAGSRSQPGSVQTLMPGDRAVIRMARKIDLSAETVDVGAVASALPVRAMVRFENRPLETSWAEVQSTNSIPVRFRPRPIPKPRQ